PGSSDPRSTRRSAYGPIHSTATTDRRSRRGTPELLLRRVALLQRNRMLRACFRDGVDGRPRAGQRRDAGNACDDGGLADRVSVAARIASFRRVDDATEPPLPQPLDERPPLLHLRDLDAGRGEHARGTGGRRELEPEPREPARDGDGGDLVG